MNTQPTLSMNRSGSNSENCFLSRSGEWGCLDQGLFSNISSRGSHGSSKYRIYSVQDQHMQTRCIVKGESQKSPLFWRFFWVFDFSEALVL